MKQWNDEIINLQIIKYSLHLPSQPQSQSLFKNLRLNDESLLPFH